MKPMHALCVLAMPALLAAAGCYQEMNRTHRSFADAAPQGRASPNVRMGEPKAAAARPGDADAAKPREVKMQADEKIVNPILDARGNWTVRVAWTYCNLTTKRSALSYANELAESLQKKGYRPYVTDFLTRAIVSVGAWDDPQDPELKRVWKEMYDAWLEVHGGHKSGFRAAMEGFYGKDTPFGDHPMPVSIIDLQVKMKGAYGIELTEDDKRRYKEYREGRRR